MKMLGGLLEEGKLVIETPDLVSTVAAIETPSSLAWIGIDPAAVERHSENASKHYPCIVGLPARLGGETIAPAFKFATATLLR
jgi:hypothetical protein